MKFLDERGMLFGKLNIIDAFIVIALIAGLAFVGIRMSARKIDTPEVASNSKEVVYVVRVVNSPADCQDYITIGDKLVANNAYVNGKIEGVEVKDYIVNVSTSEGEVRTDVDKVNKAIFVTMSAPCDTSLAVIRVGGQEVSIGTSYYVKTQKVNLLGRIESMEFR